MTKLSQITAASTATDPALTDYAVGVSASGSDFRYLFQSAANTVLSAVNEITPQQFGVVNDGSSIDITKFNTFLAAASNKTVRLSGTYNLPSLPTVTALSNSRWVGDPGNATITGAFGYVLLQLGACSNVSFENIKFNNTYTNVVFQGSGTVHSQNVNINRLRFSRCEFTVPNANSDGLAIIGRFNDYPTDSATITGLWIEDCYFHDIGAAGCVVMNRGFSDANKYAACSQIYFNRNKSSNIGSIGGGLLQNLLSLDGVGEVGSTDDNLIAGCTGYCGIENTGFRNFSHRNNNSSDGSIPVILEGTDATNGHRVMTGLSIVDNKMTTSGTGVPFSYFVKDSYFAGNVWKSQTRGYQARGFQSNTIVGDKYIMDNASGDFAMLVEGGTTNVPTGSLSSTNNSWLGAYFDNSAATSTATVLFDGTNASVTGNVLDILCKIVPSGGTPNPFSQSGGATANYNGTKEVHFASTFQVTVNTADRLDYGVTRASGWSFSASGDLVQSNAGFHVNATGIPAFVLTSAGSNYSQIANADAHSWFIGYDASATSNGTAVITWTDNGKITLAPVSGGVDVTTTLQVGSGSTDQATISGGATGASFGSSAGTLTFKPAGTNRLDYGVTRASGWSFSASGDLVQSNAGFHVNTAGIPAFILTSVGSNYGQIANGSAHSWFLGYDASATSNGTPVITWTDNSHVTIAPNSGMLAITGGIATTGPRTITGSSDTLTATDSSLICNRAGTVTLALPSASSNPGRWLTVKTITANTVISSTTNVIPESTSTAGSAILAATAGKWADLQSDSTNWVIMRSN